MSTLEKSILNASRRSFLRGTGAMMATGATGGVSAVVGAAAKSAAAVATGAAAGGSRLSMIFEALGVSGGFPKNAVERLAGMSCVKDGMSRIAGYVLGDQGFRKEKRTWGPMGCEVPAGELIDFTTERTLLDLLRHFPSDVPLMELLGDDVFERISSGHRGDCSSYFTLSRSNLEKARELLQPFCSSSTTAGELVGQFEGYFIKMARHALKHPDDFYIMAQTPAYQEWWPSGPKDVQSRSDIKDLSEIFFRFENHADEAGKIRRDLELAMERHKEISRDRLFAELQRRREHVKVPSAYKWQEPVNLKEYLELKENPPRKAFLVELVPGADGKCVVVNGIQKIVPTRMDWLHWVQTLDPQGAKASDVEVDCQGRLVTIRNQAALKDVMNRASGHSAVRVYLPNRRAGVDLNYCEPQKPAFL